MSLDSMFYNCSHITSLDISQFNTVGVKKMSYMFRGCTGLKSLDLTSFDTSQVTDISYMFCHCQALKTLDISTFNLSNVTNLAYVFYKCFALTSIKASKATMQTLCEHTTHTTYIREKDLAVTRASEGVHTWVIEADNAAEMLYVVDVE